jgi:hypothetical protein
MRRAFRKKMDLQKEGWPEKILVNFLGLLKG